MFSLPKNVTIIEVGPRDGLQNESRQIPTEAKLAFIDALQEAGIVEMEITSFVSPKWVPQMADAAKIIKNTRKQGRQFVLTPNEKGFQHALSAYVKSIAVFVGVSNTFNKKNINRTIEESLTELKPLIHYAKAQGIFVRACISTAFYCPYEGNIKKEAVIDVCQNLVDIGVDELSVADTIGKANPLESYTLFQTLLKTFPNTLLTAHFHDTERMAMANIFAALQAGITRFDTSAGGLGGCPFAPGATGNVATEDVVHMLDTMGIHTGIDVKKIGKAVAHIAPYLSRTIDTAMYRLYKKEQL